MGAAWVTSIVAATRLCRASGRLRFCALTLPAVLLATVAHAQLPYLVRDINTASAGGNPSDLTEVGGAIFFVAHEPDGTAQLWKSDGTPTGTVRVADVPRPFELTDVSGTLFFAAADPTGGYQLWKSDGTAPGTLALAHFDAPPAPAHFTAVGTTLFFAASETSAGDELWKSDGTPAPRE